MISNPLAINKNVSDAALTGIAGAATCDSFPGGCERPHEKRRMGGVMRLGRDRRNWTHSPEVSAKLGCWVGYQLDPIKKVEGKTVYIAGMVRADGRVSANTEIGIGHTPEFALDELLRNNGAPVEQEVGGSGTLDRFIKSIRSAIQNGSK